MCHILKRLQRVSIKGAKDRCWIWGLAVIGKLFKNLAVVHSLNMNEALEANIIVLQIFLDKYFPRTTTRNPNVGRDQKTSFCIVLTLLQLAVRL